MIEFDRDFQPDYRHLLAAAENRRPQRLPLYEHIIAPASMEAVTGRPFADLIDGDESDQGEFFARYCAFFRQMTYDTVSYEVCVTEILPGGGALLGEKAGPIQNRADFDAYPWGDLPRLWWQAAEGRFERLAEAMPDGMKLIGGIGNGVFEISEDLVGFEQLCYLQADDPELFDALYARIGDLLVELWTGFLNRFGDLLCVARIGDDMGFKTGTLLQPAVLIDKVVPQYARVIEVIHGRKLRFLLHSCGKIFELMEPLIAAGIDAKHSNEDAIADFGRWIDLYGYRIGLFGGIDTDRLCRMAPEDIRPFVLGQARRFRDSAQGFALGSGNSIPDYVPAEGYLAMIEAAVELRRQDRTA